MKDVASGLAGLHSKNIAHGDLKPTKILITTNGAKIGDFGSIKALTSQTGTSCDREMKTDSGDRFFQAPELFKEVRYGLKSDVFSLGLVCVAMIQAIPGKTLLPVVEGSTINLLATIGQQLLENPRMVVLKGNENDHELLTGIRPLVTSMLQVSPGDRLSSSGVELVLGSLVQVK